MTNEIRLQIINDLIEEAKKLTQKSYRSPSIDLWENRVKRFVKDEYDEPTVHVFERAISWGGIVEDGTQDEAHEEAMGRGIDFLEGLKLESVPNKSVNEPIEQPLHGQREQRKPGGQQFNISGGNVMLHTGNGDINQDVTVRDIIVQLSKEIERMPESQEKKSVLHALKAITTNETFASVSGAFIGTLLGKIVNPASH